MRFVLTHIPRTGGTSLFAALQAHLPKAKSIEFESSGEIALMSDKELNSYEIISTYVGSKIFDRLEGSWTKIVILRDPATRLKSSYWHLKSNPNCISFATSLARTLGYREYMASRENSVIFQATNVQTWSILGDRSLSFRHKYDQLNGDKICQISFERLAAYDFVGFTESLDDIWRNICQRFHWPTTQLPRLRMNEPLPELKDPHPEDLAFHTAMDSELIRQIRKLHGI